jgi:hypothetical protein
MGKARTCSVHEGNSKWLQRFQYRTLCEDCLGDLGTDVGVIVRWVVIVCESVEEGALVKYVGLGHSLW